MPCLMAKLMASRARALVMATGIFFVVVVALLRAIMIAGVEWAGSWSWTVWSKVVDSWRDAKLPVAKREIMAEH